MRSPLPPACKRLQSDRLGDVRALFERRFFGRGERVFRQPREDGVDLRKHQPLHFRGICFARESERHHLRQRSELRADVRILSLLRDQHIFRRHERTAQLLVLRACQLRFKLFAHGPVRGDGSLCRLAWCFRRLRSLHPRRAFDLRLSLCLRMDDFAVTLESCQRGVRLLHVHLAGHQHDLALADQLVDVLRRLAEILSKLFLRHAAWSLPRHLLLHPPRRETIAHRSPRLVQRAAHVADPVLQPATPRRHRCECSENFLAIEVRVAAAPCEAGILRRELVEDRVFLGWLVGLRPAPKQLVLFRRVAVARNPVLPNRFLFCLFAIEDSLVDKRAAVLLNSTSRTLRGNGQQPAPSHAM
jgi:hypothetical protein